ncbi:TPA: hypothetical protein N2826_003975 [Vibrio parahaemolyticus]|uniref:hypothetical protein n=1 Tax=Vibrio parahaemolyticus TaxID=670 RepID=UPI001123965F|nr:hypothetical protein [Vibrio parahaemolyticus]MBE4286443.1 hypothetical protein [Vibrio parahaemolyticus]TOH18935.1 hypothetical protein CGI90_04250 [Vibrio parahaemolyticus]HCM0798014.1 hypothetical protein [Vibrio parahaemolyticus]HCM0883492.1 hypothetical protein [Vibrio parahaemolyticus]HCM1326709.1 hypothetical protein [Vibrio parahaemolyticus]
MNKSMFSDGSRIARPFVIPQKGEQNVEQTETAFFESVSDDSMLESIQKIATANERMSAGAACVQWAQGGESSFDTLDAMLFGLAGGVDDTELTDGQSAMYESLQAHASEFLMSVGGVQGHQLTEMMEGDEEVTDALFESLSTSLEGIDSDEAVAEFAVRESMMMEAKQKVIRDGKVTFINTKKRKRRMSAAQKAALKKARSKAHTGAAKAARKKANRMRSSRGMD